MTESQQALLRMAADTADSERAGVLSFVPLDADRLDIEELEEWGYLRVLWNGATGPLGRVTDAGVAALVDVEVEAMGQR
jgi:hypothetical protein